MKTLLSPVTGRDISRHRSVLYGFAALMILFCHMDFPLPGGPLFAPVRWLRTNGSAGVDIFVLLTGMGLYRSMQKHTVREFYARRFVRVIPCAFIVSFIYYGLSTGSLTSLIGSVTFFPNWFGVPGLWFVPFILTAYIVYPALYRLQQRAPKALWVLFGASVLAAAAAYYLLGSVSLGNILAILRIPVFLLGCIIAPALNREIDVPRWIAPVSLVCYALMASCHYVFGSDDLFVLGESYIFLALFLTVVFAKIARLMARMRPLHFVYRSLAIVGGVSLEIYLIFSRLTAMMRRLPVYTSGSISLMKLEILSAFLTLLLSVGLARLCEYLTTLYRRTPVPEEGRRP